MKVCYWREKIPGTYSADKRFPCFIVTEGEESKSHIYGLPSHEYPGMVKVGHTAGHAPSHTPVHTTPAHVTWIYKRSLKKKPFSDLGWAELPLVCVPVVGKDLCYFVEVRGCVR